jgi:hypothetical protein
VRNLIVNIKLPNLLVLVGSLLLGIVPCHAQGMSDDEVLEKTVIRLEQIAIKNHLALAFEQMFFRAWYYGNEVNFGLSPEEWSPSKRAALAASPVDKSRRFQDKDLQRLLTEYERIKAKYVDEFERFPTTQKEQVKKNLSWWYTSDRSKKLGEILNDPNKQAGWIKQIKYKDQSTRLLGLSRLILQISPDRFLNADVDTLRDLQPLDSTGRYSRDMFVRTHLARDFLIHSDAMRGVLPADFDLNGLRKLDLEIHDQWKSWNNYLISLDLSDLDTAINTLNQGLIWNAATAASQTLQVDAKDAIPKGFKLLAARLQTSSDTTNYCKGIRSLFDGSSLRLKWTEWEKIQLVDGSLAMQSQKAMDDLIIGYSRGCFSPNRDSQTARRLLEAWANKHGDKGKLAGATHCKLAFWYQFGIGGGKDLKKSAEWLDRANTQAGVTCGPWDRYDDAAVEPTDPWRELK